MGVYTALHFKEESYTLSTRFGNSLVMSAKSNWHKIPADLYCDGRKSKTFVLQEGLNV